MEEVGCGVGWVVLYTYVKSKVKSSASVFEDFDVRLDGISWREHYLPQTLDGICIYTTRVRS